MWLMEGTSQGLNQWEKGGGGDSFQKEKQGKGRAWWPASKTQEAGLGGCEVADR